MYKNISEKFIFLFWHRQHLAVGQGEGVLSVWGRSLRVGVQGPAPAEAQGQDPDRDSPTEGDGEPEPLPQQELGEEPHPGLRSQLCCLLSKLLQCLLPQFPSASSGNGASPWGDPRVRCVPGKPGRHLAYARGASHRRERWWFPSRAAGGGAAAMGEAGGGRSLHPPSLHSCHLDTAVSCWETAFCCL